MSKSLGEITPDQLCRFIGLLEEHELNSREFPDILKSKRLSRLLNQDSVLFHWSWAYEYTMIEMLVMAMAGLGLGHVLIEASKTVDPQQSMLDFVKNYDPDFSDGRPKASTVLFNLALMMATHHTIRSLKMYAKSMNALLHYGRNGDDESYISAVRVDPSALSAPSLAKRIAVATIGEDKRFIRKIHKAAIDGPHASLRVHEKLRFSAVLLAEAGSFKVASREHIYRVLVEELNLYESRKGDPIKGLFRNLDLWRKAATT